MNFSDYWEGAWNENFMPEILNSAMCEVAQNAWEAATLAERERCASVSGPKCAEAILEAAGMACCDNNE